MENVKSLKHGHIYGCRKHCMQEEHNDSRQREWHQKVDAARELYTWSLSPTWIISKYTIKRFLRVWICPIFGDIISNQLRKKRKSSSNPFGSYYPILVKGTLAWYFFDLWIFSSKAPIWSAKSYGTLNYCWILIELIEIPEICPFVQ